MLLICRALRQEDSVHNTPTRGQFHQCSTCSFYVHKLRAQLFCAYVLGLYFTDVSLLVQKLRENVDKIEPRLGNRLVYLPLCGLVTESKSNDALEPTKVFCCNVKLRWKLMMMLRTLGLMWPAPFHQLLNAVRANVLFGPCNFDLYHLTGFRNTLTKCLQ